MKLHPVKVHIKNFQSIDDLEIEVQGFTCITGPSNIGKSALVRATSSAILNNPVVNMVRKGTQFCTVEVASEEWGFKWEKNDKGINRVYIPPNNITAQDKIGQTQVADIVKMGFGSVEIGDDEIQPWFAPQFEPLFLLNQSGPRVTDFLSEVSRLTKLQDAIILAARGKRASTDKAKVKSEEAFGIKTKLAKVSGFDTLEKLGSDLDEQAKSIEEYEARIALGESFAAQRKESERVIGLLEKIEGLKSPRDYCGELVKKIQELYQFCFQLEAAAVKIRRVHPITTIKIPDELTSEVNQFREVQKFAKIVPLRQSVKILEDVSKVKVPDAKKLKVEVDKLRQMSGFAIQIQALQTSVALLDQDIPIPTVPFKELEKLQFLISFDQQTKGLQAEISEMESQLTKARQELADVEAEIASIPSCPSCNRPLNAQHTGKHKKVSARL